MGKLIFTRLDATARRLALQNGARLVEPHHRGDRFGSTIHGWLRKGRTVVLTMDPVPNGLDLPEDSVVAFHPECPASGTSRDLVKACLPPGIAQTVLDQPEPEPDALPLSGAVLIFAATASTALVLADRLGGVPAIHRSELPALQEALAAGQLGVTTLDAVEGRDFHAPRGALVLLDPECPPGPARSRADTLAVICESREPTALDAELFLLTLAGIRSERMARPVPNLVRLEEERKRRQRRREAELPTADMTQPEPAPAEVAEDHPEPELF
ncbi:hypothetical protein LAZ40_01435 [Cereibacter sphaeroides]|uniref:hypothetical protein n=1 Tax=Cereibacter sphaeroides TaxID=1063 RepID=UPI001F2C7863|nr:hypothetical protein [Cereibacter sphaeroides]MCE6957722.1 hypothetical protein [Cereibacter sphaeroides]MCE6971508.1 hypothetical protein [Cereibacter sphaeroides]